MRRVGVVGPKKKDQPTHSSFFGHLPRRNFVALVSFVGLVSFQARVPTDDLVIHTNVSFVSYVS